MDFKYRIRLQNKNQRSLKPTTFITIFIVIITIIDITQITKYCYCANLSSENNEKASTEYSISTSSSSSSSPSNLSSSSQQSSTLSGISTINSTTTTAPSSSASSSSTKHYVAVSHSPKIQKRAGNVLSSTDSKIKKAITVHDEHNSDEQDDSVIDADGVSHAREALSQDGSQRDPIVYLSENAGYIPINSLRGRPGILPGSGGIGSYNQQHNHHHHQPHNVGPSLPSSHSQQPIDLDGWVPDQWDREYNRRTRFNASRVQHIEAECQDDYMKIRIGFNGSFTGLLYSAGYAYDPDCMYINGSGRDYYEFFIQLNRCGTLGKNAIHEKSREHPTNFMWNTITVQYNPLIEEEFDEHFKVTCEYGYDFWKTVTFPFLDVEVATGNPVVFTLSPPECYMEIRNGYGAGGTRVTGPVRVGDPLTLMIYMRSKYDGFDIVVNDCYAHNGANKRIQLIDEYGCPVDDKLISRFRGTWSDTGIFETQVYAYMKTFRFTGSPALYIECDVRMCHGRCPSQPCHWRNVKSITKRDVSSNQNQTIFDDNRDTNKTIENNSNADGNNTNKEQALSDNISLFQSLQVLQEGENDDENNNNNNSNYKNLKESSETCIKTSILSTILGTCCLLVCVLSGLILITCSKLRYRNKDSVLYNAYINHKGQID